MPKLAIPPQLAMSLGFCRDESSLLVELDDFALCDDDLST